MHEKNEKPARKDYGIEKKEFVRAWESSTSVDDCQAKLTEIAVSRGLPPMPRAVVIARASDYRAAGIDLKKHRPGRKAVQDEVRELNAYIASLREKSSTTIAPASPETKPGSAPVPPEVAQELARQLLAEWRGKKDGDSVSKASF